MNKMSFTFLLTVFIGFTNGIVGMEDKYILSKSCDRIALSEVEKEIFLREVNRVGIDKFSEQLAQKKSPQYMFSDYKGPNDINVFRGLKLFD